VKPRASQGRAPYCPIARDLGHVAGPVDRLDLARRRSMHVTLEEEGPVPQPLDVEHFDDGRVLGGRGKPERRR